tara:strand:+ start:7054 stop:8328 length:1275 start_codon:yes stop_codon:yes gene_type:complete
MATTTNKTWQKDDDTTAIDQDAFINAFLDDLDASLFARGANSAKPGSPNNGDTFYDTDASRFIKYNGSAWVQVMPDAVNVIDSDHYVDGSIDGVHLAADVISGAKIADDAIDSEHYTDGSIDNAHIADDAIDSEHYADGSIDNAHIADDAIDSEHYADGSIDNAHIADDAIDSEHYADGSIDNAHIADDAIDSEHYVAGSIDSAHLADDAVTLAKTAAGTQGGIQYYAGSGVPSELAAGTNGHFLKTQGTSANPVWAALTAATTSVSGAVELATAAEIDTGTDTGRAVGVDEYAGSKRGEVEVQLVAFGAAVDTATGDGKVAFTISDRLAGMNIKRVYAFVNTAGSGGTTTVQLRNATQTADILSTAITIDSAELHTSSAATPAVISGSEDDLTENDIIHVDVDAVHSSTAAKGLVVGLICGTP